MRPIWAFLHGRSAYQTLTTTPLNIKVHVKVEGADSVVSWEGCWMAPKLSAWLVIHQISSLSRSWRRPWGSLSPAPSLRWHYCCTHLLQCTTLTWATWMVFDLRYLFHYDSFCSLLKTNVLEVSFWNIKHTLLFHYFPSKAPIVWHAIQGPLLSVLRFHWLSSYQFEPNHFQNCLFVSLSLCSCCVPFLEHLLHKYYFIIIPTS